ncbi:MAG: methyl-accepting chemotaxis protein, partial [Agathobacter sp.]|nr:methyl-accepting chemotaxis protein [Agathobacter sp.]
MKKKGVTRQKTRKMNIRMKILLPVLIIMLVVSSGMGTLMFLIGESAYTQMGVEQSKMAASIATTMIDGKSIAKIGAGAETSSLYASQLKQLREIKETCGILYMYTIYEENGEFYYGVDTDESEGQCMPGDVYDDDLEPVKTALSGEMYVRDYIVSNEYGNLISSYVPIEDDAGNIVAVLGCDYDGTEALRMVSIIQTLSMGCTVAALLISAVVVAIFVNAITKNVVLINTKIYDLVNNEGDLTQKLDIHSGDELELIGNNVNNLLEYIRSIMLNISGNSTNLQDASQEVFNNLKSAEMNITDV